MAGYGAAFGRGVIIGAGAALAYAAARETASLARNARLGGLPPALPKAADDRLIDWHLAERLAVRASGQAPTLHPAAREQLEAEYRKLMARIDEPIARYTGNRLSLAGTAIVAMDRPAWIRANLRTFRDLLAPVEAFYRRQTTQGTAVQAAQRPARMLLAAEMGLLMGYLARRVLGQYDLSLMGTEPIEGGTLYFVEPNLRQVEQSLGVPRDEFRAWIALHEATHAHEFELHPWVREHLNEMMRTYLTLLTADMERGGAGNVGLALVTRLVENLRRGHTIIAALQSPEQRALLSRLQALMSLAEGYSNHVMNAVGRSLLPHFDLIHDRVEHRQRERSTAEVWFLRLTGLSLKMEQYKRGEAFVDAVAAARGIAFVNRAWEGPENLPSEDEIAHPERWLARLGATA